MLKNILIIFFAINAIFWSFFSHKTHCELVGLITNISCPSHSIHITIGVISFFIALIIAQYNYFKILF